jgi:acyl-coenzyme A thioesterase PaaI-like protein
LDTVRISFAEQALMRTLGAELTKVLPGEINIEMPFDPAFGQQDGFLHAGAITASRTAPADLLPIR